MPQHMLRLKIIFFFLAVVLLSSRLTWGGQILVGSLNSREPADEIKKFLPISTYLAKQLQSEGLEQGKVVVAKSVPEMAAFLRDGKVDLYIDSPFPSLAVSRLSGSKFLLRRWKKGIGEYHSVIFARKDSGINLLEDLQGKLISFEEPYSSTGYFLPKLSMMQKGLKLVAKNDVFDPVGQKEVGYVFSYDDENTMVWVLRGGVKAGAMDHQSYLKQARGSLEILRIIEKTFSIPRQIVSHREDLSPKLVGRIKQILIQMDQVEEGKKALRDFENTTKFDEIPSGSLEPFLKFQRVIEAEYGRR